MKLNLLFERVEEVGDGPKRIQWGDPRNRAVIACDGDGRGCLLHWVGAGIQYMVEEVDGTLEGLRLDHADAGIWVWEGRLDSSKTWTDCGYEYDCELEGEFRAPTDDEWAAIRRNECPWPPAQGEIVWDDPEELSAARVAMFKVLRARAVQLHLASVFGAKGDQ